MDLMTELYEALKDLLTASQILDGDSIPRNDDVVYFLDSCEKAQAVLDKIDRDE